MNNIRRAVYRLFILSPLSIVAVIVYSFYFPPVPNEMASIIEFLIIPPLFLAIQWGRIFSTSFHNIGDGTIMVFSVIAYFGIFAIIFAIMFLIEKVKNKFWRKKLG